jgi:hypothetical protein
MKLLLIIITICSANMGYAINIDGFEISDNEIKESEQGLQTWRNFAEEAKVKPSTDLIPKLGLGLRKTTLTSVYVAGDRLETRKLIQDALLAIPGHAEFYANRINNARAEVDDAFKQGKYPPFNDLLDEQMYGFETLAQLPSPETVRVLGEFLSDDRGRFDPSPDLSEEEIIARRKSWGQKPNSLLAAKALNDLSLKTRPYPKKQFTHDDDIRPWQLWYQQVKAGRRTFTFEGSPQEYDLTGPVREARSPDVARVTKRPGVSSEASAVKAGKSSTHFATPWVAGILIMMAGIGAYVYLQNKRRS